MNVLDSMGVNPFGSGRSAPQQRYLKLVKAIHIVASEAGLITRDEERLLDTAAYREFIRQWSRGVIGREVSSCAGLAEGLLQSLLAALREYQKSNDMA